MDASASLMPPLVGPGAPIGRVSGRHAALDGAVITLAGHDHQAATVGTGGEAIGDGFDSSGAAEALIRTAGSGLTASQVGALAAAGVTTAAKRMACGVLSGSEVYEPGTFAAAILAARAAGALGVHERPGSS